MKTSSNQTVQPLIQPIYQVDAFTGALFSGNPAAVCPLDSWLPDATLRAIAAENNLSETAFFVRRPSGDFELRWFTPTVEVELCGHATLASAFVLFEKLELGRSRLRFHTRRAGELVVERKGDWIELDFPLRTFERLPSTVEGLASALGFEPVECFLTSSGTYLVLAQDEETVRKCSPDFSRIRGLGRCVSITAKSALMGSGADFVSRYFAPTHGIDEDPVTGSSFCYLAPFWAEKLGRTDLYALQVSQRGGIVRARMDEDRVKISGQAVLYLEGRISLPA